jgi:hypothetical protein
MRRLLAFLALALSLLSPVALPIAAQRPKTAQSSNQTQTGEEVSPRRLPLPCHEQDSH